MEKEIKGINNQSEIAISFLKLATSGNIREAYEKFVHSQFRHHNPFFNGDRQSLLTGMEENSVQFPNKKIEVIRTLEDNDLVAIHAKIKLSPDMPEIALIHIFRFEENMIIEEWEVGQAVPENTKNENGMF